MQPHWIQIALLSFGIILSTSFFLRSSFLKKKNAQKLEDIDKKIESRLILLDLKADLIQRSLQEAVFELKTINIRTVIVETRLEERKESILLEPGTALTTLGRAAKRGRPPKITHK